MWNKDMPRERVGAPPMTGDSRPIDERRLAAWIGRSVIVKGNVICSEDLTIDGQVEGTIELGDHSLTIGVGAGVKADLVAKIITISGAVKGNIIARDKVELRATSSVDGDIVAPRVVIAEGATLLGRIETSRERPTSGPH